MIYPVTIQYLVANHEVVRRVHPARVRQLRTLFKKEKPLFKLLCIAELTNRHKMSRQRAIEVLRVCTAHHILPLYLGGTNALHNIAMVENEFHEAIHRYFECQTWRDKKLPIPRAPEGQLVWISGVGRNWRGVPIKIPYPA